MGGRGRVCEGAIGRGAKAVQHMRHDLEGWERRGKSQARDAAVGGLGKACGCMQGEHLHLASAGLCEGRSSQVDDGPKGFAMDVRIDDDPPHVINFRHCQQSREGGENRGGVVAVAVRARTANV